MLRAVYPGTFDPITNGHLDVIARGASMFDELIVAVSDNPSKSLTFSKKERVGVIRRLTKSIPNVRVDTFNGLAVNYVRSVGSRVILRGIRTISDFEYEFQMALMNRAIAPNVETVFVMTCEKYAHISSHLTKEAASFGADLRSFVPADVERLLKRKLVVSKRKHK
ncbi:MAG: pantetheine-phosphate adenylyltransferase [Planctomycetota bacterium]|nr:pantetheine-phosphate adenylyltransferase [Planctomycetota bacterium]